VYRSIFDLGLIALTTLILLAATTPTRAADWRSEDGDLFVRFDSFFSVSSSIRVSDRDCRQIAQINGGCNIAKVPGADDFTQGVANTTMNGRLLNSDDGNLNVDQWDVYSVMVSMGHDLDVEYKNYGALVRVSYFYDAVQNGWWDGQFPRRTRLDQDSRYTNNILDGGVVGYGFRLLDAYVYGKWDIMDRPWNVRLGNQVVNWGEEFFTQGGIKVTNAFDVTKLRVAGTELKEGLLPAPMLLVSGDLYDNLSLSAYYQFAWNKTQIDPPGTFYSVADVVGHGTPGQFTNAGDNPTASPKGDPGTEFNDTRPPTPCYTTGISATDHKNHCEGDTFTYKASDYFYGKDTPPFAFGGMFAGLKQWSDKDAKSQGQWGVALRYYSSPLETEFALYRIVYHDKTPTVSYRGDGAGDGFVFEPECTPGVKNAACPIGTTGMYREYLEDISLYGASFNTVLFDVAVGGEVSYRRNAPTPVSTATTEQANKYCNPDNDCLTQIQKLDKIVSTRGAVREERLMFILNGLYNAGPGTPVFGDIIRLIGSDDLVLIGELGMARYPHLSDDTWYAGPPSVTFWGGLAPRYTGAPQDMEPFKNAWRPDKTSWGYQARFSANYTQFLGSAWTFTPAIAFRHDVSGSTPDSAVQFNEGLKTVGINWEFNYQNRWKAILAYSNSFGAGVANYNNDRDFAQITVSYAF